MFASREQTSKPSLPRAGSSGRKQTNRPEQPWPEIFPRRGRDPDLQPIGWSGCLSGTFPQEQKSAEEREVEREMPGEAERLACMSEATAGDIESTGFGHHAGNKENSHESRHNEYGPTKENARNQSEPAEDFQPGKIERGP